MRKIICYFIIAFSIISCSSEKASSEQDAIIGEWNWIESSGGIAGTTTTPQSTGKSIQLKITSAKVIQYVDGALVSEINYSIQTGTSIFGGQRKLLVYDSGIKKSFEQTNSQLILNDECFDYYQNKYIKQ